MLLNHRHFICYPTISYGIKLPEMLMRIYSFHKQVFDYHNFFWFDSILLSNTGCMVLKKFTSINPLACKASQNSSGISTFAISIFSFTRFVSVVLSAILFTPGTFKANCTQASAGFTLNCLHILKNFSLQEKRASFFTVPGFI